MQSPRYRPNVAAIIRKNDGRILIGERFNIPGCWQFPQGGVKKSEPSAEALIRELKEEVSLETRHYRVVDSKGPYRYLFGQGRTKEGYHGQEQTYFLVDLLASESQVSAATESPEFRQIRWIRPEEFQISWLPGFKQDVYRKVFLDFFGVKI
jgi:putative (di)nucleoside polyphosphate hydrolase